jgi:hypothetical protein
MRAPPLLLEHLTTTFVVNSLRSETPYTALYTKLKRQHIFPTLSLQCAVLLARPHFKRAGTLFFHTAIAAQSSQPPKIALPPNQAQCPIMAVVGLHLQICLVCGIPSAASASHQSMTAQPHSSNNCTPNALITTQNTSTKNNTATTTTLGRVMTMI